MAFEKETKKGVTKFGFVTNLRSFVQEANALLSEEESEFRSYELNTLVETVMAEKRVEYKNKFGKNTTEDCALYAIFPTSKKAKSGDVLIAYYERQRVEKNWTGICFTTKKDFAKDVKGNLMFRLGNIYFENWQDGLQFLEDLKTKCIPEKWNYRSHESGIPHPILKSYIENTFEKLKVENGGAKFLKAMTKNMQYSIRGCWIDFFTRYSLSFIF